MTAEINGRHKQPKRKFVAGKLFDEKGRWTVSESNENGLRDEFREFVHQKVNQKTYQPVITVDGFGDFLNRITKQCSMMSDFQYQMILDYVDYVKWRR